MMFRTEYHQRLTRTCWHFTHFFCAFYFVSLGHLACQTPPLFPELFFLQQENPVPYPLKNLEPWLNGHFHGSPTITIRTKGATCSFTCPTKLLFEDRGGNLFTLEHLQGTLKRKKHGKKTAYDVKIHLHKMTLHAQHKEKKGHIDRFKLIGTLPPISSGKTFEGELSFRLCPITPPGSRLQTFSCKIPCEMVGVWNLLQEGTNIWTQKKGHVALKKGSYLALRDLRAAFSGTLALDQNNKPHTMLYVTFTNPKPWIHYVQEKLPVPDRIKKILLPILRVLLHARAPIPFELGPGKVTLMGFPLQLKGTSQ